MFMYILFLLFLTLSITLAQDISPTPNSATPLESTSVASANSIPLAPQQILTFAATNANTPDDQSMPQVTFPTLSAPQPSDDAKAAISGFNQDRVGGTMQVVYAGNLTNPIQSVLQALPRFIQVAMLNGRSISSVSYWGLLDSGVSMVAAGDCATDIAFCTVTIDNLSDQMSSASMGIYALVVNKVPATAQEAATLIRSTFPRIDRLLFLPIDNSEKGFAFSAVTTNNGYDFYNRKSISVPEVVYSGVIPYGGARTLVYALVALGEGYVDATTVEGATLNFR